jgi:hypothetical protein
MKTPKQILRKIGEWYLALLFPPSEPTVKLNGEKVCSVRVVRGVGWVMEVYYEDGKMVDVKKRVFKGIC